MRGAKKASTLLAITAYEGISAPTVLSLFQSQQIDEGLDLQIFSGNCHVDDGRNLLVRDFLVGEWDQMIFLDADVSWLVSDIKRLVEAKADIVAGIYPKKNADGSTDYPVKSLPGDRWADDDGLVEVEAVPTGFLKIRRKVFETLYETVDKYRDEKDHSQKQIPVIFERTLDGRVRRGGDFEFCRKARAAGFKVMVDPTMYLAHQGSKLWTGCLGNYWRRDIAIPDGLAAIRENRADAATFAEMYNVWDNTWTLAPEALYAITQYARKATKPILECGSGLSTLCMAAATVQPVIALEHMPTWASKIDKMSDNADIRLSSIKQYDGFSWYADVPKEKFDLVVIDGPPASTGRGGVFQLLNGEIKEATIVVDDIERSNWREEVEEYCQRAGRKLTIVECSRDFGIIHGALG